MKLTYFRGTVPNFGDELNTYLWERLIGKDFFDDRGDELFVGVGSIIYDVYPREARKIVVGSGYGGYTPVPDVHDGSWKFAFVRGPKTAQVLNIPMEKAITDGAVLVRAIPLPQPSADSSIAFIPHFESLDRGLWQDVCHMAGIRLIDPTAPVPTVLSQIRGARAVVVEAMHGAIIADALRTPWIAVTPIHKAHRFKWLDWSESLSIEYRSHRLFPSSLREMWTLVSGGQGQGTISRVCGGSVASPANTALKHMAARRLQWIAKQEPQLSDSSIIATATERALEVIDALRVCSQTGRAG